jgi:uncharacterized membrane protein
VTQNGPQPRFEQSLVRLMLTGVWVSTAFLTTGLLMRLANGHSIWGDRLLHVGLVVLMATPVLRVVLSMVEAIGQRDWFWLWTTVGVALVLAGTVAYSLHAL